MSEAVTFEDVLHNGIAAGLVVKFLELEDKRQLRLVSHAGKDAVDKTVTSVKFDCRNQTNADQTVDYGYVLAKSNWKEVNAITIVDFFENSSQTNSPQEAISLFAEGGFSKLKVIFVPNVNHSDFSSSAQKAIKAGWKLKMLGVGYGLPSEWFGTVMRDANWPLEVLYLLECSDEILKIISNSRWMLKFVRLHSKSNTPEGVECLMQGSWVSTVEKLTLKLKMGEKGGRAISKASHRSLSLTNLEISESSMANKEVLLLAEGSYPNLEKLEICPTPSPMEFHVVAAILKKCPRLEQFILASYSRSTRDADPDDVEIVKDCIHRKIIFELPAAAV